MRSGCIDMPPLVENGVENVFENKKSKTLQQMLRPSESEKQTC